MDISLFLFLILLFPVKAQKTAVLYLSGLDKDHTVQWNFFCTNGRNSNKWCKIAVPSNCELQGFGSYLYGRPNLTDYEKGQYKYEFTVSKNWQKKKVQFPDIKPGESGILSLDLPVDWKSYDALYITALDQYGRNII